MGYFLMEASLEGLGWPFIDLLSAMRGPISSNVVNCLPMSPPI